MLVLTRKEITSMSMSIHMLRGIYDNILLERFCDRYWYNVLKLDGGPKYSPVRDRVDFILEDDTCNEKEFYEICYAIDTDDDEKIKGFLTRVMIDMLYHVYVELFRRRTIMNIIERFDNRTNYGFDGGKEFDIIEPLTAKSMIERSMNNGTLQVSSMDLAELLGLEHKVLLRKTLHPLNNYGCVPDDWLIKTEYESPNTVGRIMYTCFILNENGIRMMGNLIPKSHNKDETKQKVKVFVELLQELDKI